MNSASQKVELSWRPLIGLVIYLGIILVGGALLAPWIFRAVQFLAGSANPTSFWVKLSQEPFHRYVNRCFYVFALVGFWPWLRILQTSGRQTLGFDRTPQMFRHLILGFCAGFFSLGIVLVAGSLCGAWVMSSVTTIKVIQHLVSSTLVAVVVSVIEETLFRGVIFVGLRRSLTIPSSIFLSSAIYAFVHFFQRPPQPDSVDVWSGLWCLGQMLRGFTDFNQLIPGWLNLVVIGAILAWARQRTGQLWLSVGLHAGLIFWVKTFRFWLASRSDASRAIWGGEKVYDGWMAMAALVCVAVVIQILMNHPSITGNRSERVAHD